MIPMGMLTRKIQRQLSATAGQVTYWTMVPPSVGPMAVASPDTPPHTPMATPRFPGGKTAAMMLKVDGIIAAPPMPCSTRQAISR